MQIVAPVQAAAPVQVAQPPVHGSANAVLAAALSAGDFYAPTSPPPMSKRPDNEVTNLMLCCIMSKVTTWQLLQCITLRLFTEASTESKQIHAVVW